MLRDPWPYVVLCNASRAPKFGDDLIEIRKVNCPSGDLGLRVEGPAVLDHQGLHVLEEGLRVSLDVLHLALHHVRLHAGLAIGWAAGHLRLLVALQGGPVARGQIAELLLLLRLGLQAHRVLPLRLELLDLEVLGQLYGLGGLDGELAAGVGVKGLAHGRGLGKVHGRHLGRVGILGGRGRLHALRRHLARAEVRVLHGGRGSVGEALLEAELGLLGWGLRARHGGAGRVPLLGDGGRDGILLARAVHLVGLDGARVDEARRVVHAVLGGLEVHGGARSTRTASGGRRAQRAESAERDGRRSERLGWWRGGEAARGRGDMQWTCGRLTPGQWVVDVGSGWAGAPPARRPWRLPGSPSRKERSEQEGGGRGQPTRRTDGRYRRLCIRRTRDGPSGMRNSSFTLPHVLGRDLRLCYGVERTDIEPGANTPSR